MLYKSVKTASFLTMADIYMTSVKRNPNQCIPFPPKQLYSMKSAQKLFTIF